jgi:hypothetical protein
MFKWQSKKSMIPLPILLAVHALKSVTQEGQNERIGGKVTCLQDPLSTIPTWGFKPTTPENASSPSWRLAME